MESIYELDHFKFVKCIANQQLIRKASEHLYISQPYLSTTIKELEAELKVKLFVRTSNGINLTEHGKTFLAYADEVLEIVNKARNIAGDYDEEAAKETLRVCSIYSFTGLSIFRSFVTANRAVLNKLRYKEMPNSIIPDRVSEGSQTVGICYLISNRETEMLQNLRKLELEFIPLCKERPYAVLSHLHPLAHKEKLHPGELQNYPYVVESLRPNDLSEYINDPFPHFFEKNIKMPVDFDNNRSLLHFLSESDDCFSVGQKSLNITGPFLREGRLKYIPIIDVLDNCFTTT